MGTTFEYRRFVVLAGSELCAYMEPLIRDPTMRVSQEMLDRMLSELCTYDEYHLVYALLLGADRSPDTFLVHVPEYLAHEHDSVFCTAFNILDRLPEECITQDLIDSARRVLSSHHTRNSATDLLERLVKSMGSCG